MKHPLIKLMTILALGAGCAHRAEPLQKNHAGWRVSDKKVTTGMPNYYLSPEVFVESSKLAKENGRDPASDEALAKELEAQEKKPSLRRLYFRVVYQQYKELSSNALNVCPQYHHDRLTMDEAAAKAGVFFGPELARPKGEHLAYYPEWALPVRKNGKSVPVWRVKGAAKKLLARAVQTHQRKLRRELKTLCEEGTSDAYFRLENLATYFAGQASFQNQEGFRALLKIPAFSTMLLLKTAQNGAMPSFNEHDHRLLEEVHGLQLERYIVELRKKRSGLLTGAL